MHDLKLTSSRIPWPVGCTSILLFYMWSKDSVIATQMILEASTVLLDVVVFLETILIIDNMEAWVELDT